MTMIAGRYYVGDLCYVMDDDEWREVCDLTIVNNKMVNGEFNMKDGRRFAMYCTAYGDGVFYDENEREYSVDSGSIGCILAADVKAHDKPYDVMNLGNMINFENDFDTASQRGLIRFGNVRIDTDPPYVDEEEYDEI